jgi:hypothetical protein
MTALAELDDLLDRRTPPVAALARELVALIAGMRPDLTGKVRRGWGTINYRHRRAGFVLALYPSTEHVAVIFQQGKLLSSPLLVDDGKVKQVRWIPLRPGEGIPEDEIGILIVEAIALVT